MKRYFIFLLAVVLISISALFYDVKSTFAVSDYDDTIKLIDPLTLSVNQQTIDYSNSWFTQTISSYQDLCDSGRSDACSTLNTIQDLPISEFANWAVVSDSSPVGSSINIIYSFSSNIEPQWLFKPQYSASELNLIDLDSTGAICRISLSPNPNTQLLNPYQSGGSYNPLCSSSMGLAANYSQQSIFLSTFPIVYPPGYNGLIIPDSYNPPSPPVDESPDFYIVQGIDHKIEIADNRYFTFDDPNRTLCQPDDLAPFIMYELKTLEGAIVDSGSFSPTITYSYQWPNKNSEGTYTFTGSYSCGDLDPEFIGETTVTFSMSKDGIYTDDFMATCFTETAPWVDINGCISGMSRAFNLLGFKSLQFGNTVWATFQPQCGQLSTLGHWINKPNEVLCPMFPAYVRDIVTPFVTFALGLLMLNFVAKHGGTGF